APLGPEVRQFRGHTGGVCNLRFSPDGWTLASASRDGTIRLWEAASGQERRCLKGHRGAVHSIPFSADGRTLVSGGEDTTVLIWPLDERVLAHQKQKTPPTEQLEQLWTDLASGSASRAYEAICRLTAFPGQSTPLLLDRLLKLQPMSKKVARWIRD